MIRYTVLVCTQWIHIIKNMDATSHTGMCISLDKYDTFESCKDVRSNDV
jgi:hypothetical protein